MDLFNFDSTFPISGQVVKKCPSDSSLYSSHSLQKNVIKSKQPLDILKKYFSLYRIHEIYVFTPFIFAVRATSLLCLLGLGLGLGSLLVYKFCTRLFNKPTQRSQQKLSSSKRQIPAEKVTRESDVTHVSADITNTSGSDNLSPAVSK